MNAQEKGWYDELYELGQNDYSQAITDQTAVWEGRKPNCHPLLLTVPLPGDQATRFPSWTPSETHFDLDKMLLTGMKGMAAAAQSGMQAVPSIRANMGCGIFPSLFPGIKPLLFEDGKMPWVVEHMSQDEITALREKDIVLTDEFKLALEHMAYCADKTAGMGTFVYPLDLQGPFDMAHIVYGDPFFYDMYDEPDLMHHLLDLCCYAIELGLDECLKVMPRSDEYIAHYNGVILPRSLGGIKVSEDTSTLVGAEHIDEFVVPYTTRILEYAGGGYIHYCGKNDHLLDRVLAMPLARGLNFGNPDMHDMEDILRRTAAAGKVFYGNVASRGDEPLADYFARHLSAATVDGQCKLLLMYAAERREQLGDIQAAWAAACARGGL